MLVLLILVSATAASGYQYVGFSETRRYQKRQPRFNHRQLQTLEVCVATAGSNFTQQVLGPSYEDDSLYNNVNYESAITGAVDDGSGLFTLPINELASILLDEYLLYSDQPIFVQDNEYFGRNGEFTEEMLSQHKLLTNFWQVEGPPILLIGLHSEFLELDNNLELAIAVLAFLDGYQSTVTITDDVRAVAAEARVAIETELPDGYSNYALTEDAYYQDNYGVVGYETSAAIVVGDGALQFDVFFGYGTVGSDILHAHEFSHALQYILDLDAAPTSISPETSRFSELEADAMGAYVLAHKQGRDFPVSLLLEATRSAYAIGDCSVDSDGHHGTPKQRECATKWGADEGLDMSGDPVSPGEFRTLFQEIYELILSLNSSVCSLTDDTMDMNYNTSTPTPSPMTNTSLNRPTTNQSDMDQTSNGCTLHEAVFSWPMGIYLLLLCLGYAII
jgi:hypothetical protein